MLRYVLLEYYRALSWDQFFFYYTWMTAQYNENQNCNILLWNVFQDNQIDMRSLNSDIQDN